MKKLIIVLFIGFSAMLQAQENKETKQDTIHKNKPFVLDEVIVSTAFNKIQ